MKKFGIRGFLEVFFGGCLLLTAVTLAVRCEMLKTEYREYRDGVFARGYETVIAGLSAYLKSGDAGGGSGLAAGLYTLPLSVREEETARRFFSDMAAGAYDADAKARAVAYGESLLRFLSQNRSRAYESGWRASGMGLPPYPEASDGGDALPAAAEAEDRDGEALKEAARRLLGSRVIAYSREERGETILGFRTASGFAEFREDGRLYRMLTACEPGETLSDEAACRAAAGTFLAAWGPEDAVCEAAEADGGAWFFRYRSGRTDVTLGVSRSRAAVFFYRTES